MAPDEHTVPTRTTGTRVNGLLFVLTLASLGFSGCRTAGPRRIEPASNPKTTAGCADELGDPRRQTDLVGQRTAALHQRDCLKQLAHDLKRLMDAPRPCDHFTIGVNTILCPTVDSEGALLSMTVERLDAELGVLGEEIDRRITSGASVDTGLIETATRLSRAVQRAEARTRLLEEELHDAIWGHISCPTDGKSRSTCMCSPNSMCATLKLGLPEPSCACAPTDR